MNSDNDNILTLEERLTALDMGSRVHLAGSASRVANFDSLNFILRFVYGAESNIGYVSGAFKTLGLGPDLARSVVAEIRKSVAAGHDQETAFSAVLDGTEIRCAALRDFPASSRRSSEEQEAENIAFLARMQADGQAKRKAALEVQELDRKIAKILGIEVEDLDGEWGLRRKEGGRRFEPSSEGADSFGLIPLMRLSIHHFPKDPVRGYTDVAVSHTDATTGRPTMTLHSSDFSYSLPRTLCEVAVRVAHRP